MEETLTGRRIQETAASTARQLPWVTCTHPFGEEHDVYKVREKVFLMATDATGEPIITLKVQPDAADVLREEFPSIRPGYHMNKRHWISVAEGPGVTAELIEELVVTSYDLVVSTMVASRQPIRFGLGPDDG
ncbi:MmcQ/YjbR family DNA-binding protein [Nesterenkonia sp. HG001]|uniref:MmcQ/YjbR family DNA-binding protein n=1 Tax=Nesterenkonia sp. HG001 TaxID=2983207 RepID=UPI002AC76F07|nr:MmcQ/YjbR family DNA-binding protein [Nesterenkonia sp. HG001]MDZ5077118.1 MmcQ/YjbR family DNA-binding protein [Nesterenkonia sp. HG001]